DEGSLPEPEGVDTRQELREHVVRVANLLLVARELFLDGIGEGALSGEEPPVGRPWGVRLVHLVGVEEEEGCLVRVAREPLGAGREGLGGLAGRLPGRAVLPLPVDAEAPR